MFCSSDHFVETAGIAAKLDAAVLSIGAGDIELVGGNAFALVENLNSVFIVFAGVSEDIGDDDCIFDLAQLGQFIVHKSPGADVLQADRVQHSGGSFVQTRRRV